jgi:hypothetical protein
MNKLKNRKCAGIMKVIEKLDNRRLYRKDKKRKPL